MNRPYLVHLEGHVVKRYASYADAERYRDLRNTRRAKLPRRARDLPMFAIQDTREGEET